MAKSMTYGTMPSRSAFEAAFTDSERTEGGYTFTLRGSDARTVSAYGLPAHAEFGPDELYDYIDVLRIGWEKGDEKAGDVASSMLLTLGFEWI